MSTSSPTDRFVFDAYAERPVTIYTGEALPAKTIVVTDNALVNDVDGSSMPNDGDYVTVAGPVGVARGKMIQHAYVIELESDA